MDEAKTGNRPDALQSLDPVAQMHDITSPDAHSQISTIKLIPPTMSNEIDFNGNVNNVDPSQIEIDLGHIHVRDQGTRDILRRQMEKGNITHADISTLQRYQNSWDYSVWCRPYILSYNY